jgi:hypothetical protein
MKNENEKWKMENGTEPSLTVGLLPGTVHQKEPSLTVGLLPGLMDQSVPDTLRKQ